MHGAGTGAETGLLLYGQRAERGEGRRTGPVLQRREGWKEEPPSGSKRGDNGCVGILRKFIDFDGFFDGLGGIITLYKNFHFDGAQRLAGARSAMRLAVGVWSKMQEGEDSRGRSGDWNEID